jgi:hypothetical protein
LTHGLLVDGNQLRLNRGSVDVALAYADALVAQIFARNDYGPARAMQKAASGRYCCPVRLPLSAEDLNFRASTIGAAGRRIAIASPVCSP